MSQELFIKSITTDEDNRVVVTVQEQFQSFLKEDMVKNMLRDAAKNALGEDFIQLEVSPSTFRVSVAEGSTDKAITVIKEEIAKNIEMALSFLNQFNQ